MPCNCIISTLKQKVRKIWIPKWYSLYLQKEINMTVVSIRDFRANQSKYLGLAAGGESVILTSRTGSFKIVPITEDDSLISKKEFFARIDEARKSIAEGKGTSVSGKEELDSLLASL